MQSNKSLHGDAVKSSTTGSVSMEQLCNNFNILKALPAIETTPMFSTILYIKDELFVLGPRDNIFGPRDNSITSLEKYLPAINAWEKAADMYDDRIYYCACSFMDKIFVIGGYKRSSFSSTNSCITFNTYDCKWKKVASMREVREFAGCAVFEGRVVVSGGRNGRNVLNTVEAYDHVADLWSKLPNMLQERYCHKSVSVNNKMFVVEGCTANCEVYDSFSNKFVSLKSAPQSTLPQVSCLYSQVVPIGSQILIFRSREKVVLIYDVDNDTWSEKSFQIMEHFTGLSIAKVPQNFEMFPVFI